MSVARRSGEEGAIIFDNCAGVLRALQLRRNTGWFWVTDEDLESIRDGERHDCVAEVCQCARSADFRVSVSHTRNVIFGDDRVGRGVGLHGA